MGNVKTVSIDRKLLRKPRNIAKIESFTIQFRLELLKILTLLASLKLHQYVVNRQK